MGKRLTREQSQAVTRARLLESARAVVAREGYEGASIDRIAEEAGYSKGAFYSNFSSKEELYLELLEHQAAEDLAELHELIDQISDPVQAIELLSEWSGRRASDRTWGLMVLELVRRARRDASFGERHATLYLPQWREVGLLLARLSPNGHSAGDPTMLGGVLMELTYGVGSSFTSGPHTKDLVRMTLSALLRVDADLAVA